MKTINFIKTIFKRASLLLLLIGAAAQISAAQFPSAGKAHEAVTRAAFDAAAPRVLGRQPLSDAEVDQWANLMLNEAKFKAFVISGVQFADARDFLIFLVPQPASKRLRADIAIRVYRDTHGIEPSDAELAALDKKFVPKMDTPYDTLLLQETTKMYKNQVAETMMIQRAFEAAFGRPANAAEVNKILTTDNYFARLIESHRTFLYLGTEGKAELKKTVERALKKKTGKARISVAEIDAAVKIYTPTKSIYREM